MEHSPNATSVTHTGSPRPTASPKTYSEYLRGAFKKMDLRIPSAGSGGLGQLTTCGRPSSVPLDPGSVLGQAHAGVSPTTGRPRAGLCAAVSWRPSPTSPLTACEPDWRLFSTSCMAQHQAREAWVRPGEAGAVVRQLAEVGQLMTAQEGAQGLRMDPSRASLETRSLHTGRKAPGTREPGPGHSNKSSSHRWGCWSPIAPHAH